MTVGQRHTSRRGGWIGFGRRPSAAATKAARPFRKPNPHRTRSPCDGNTADAAPNYPVAPAELTPGHGALRYASKLLPSRRHRHRHRRAGDAIPDQPIRSRGKQPIIARDKCKHMKPSACACVAARVPLRQCGSIRSCADRKQASVDSHCNHLVVGVDPPTARRRVVLADDDAARPIRRVAPRNAAT